MHHAGFYAAAFEQGKNIQRRTLVRKQSEKPSQLGNTRPVVIGFVPMIMIMIFRKRRQLRPEILEAS
ncbi:MAG TPA: hypothetical protein VFS68_12100 [Candidatus Udaeobacter sp.]|nr:hypothetical protein [Candidatus Udaeobacter sp.]